MYNILSLTVQDGVSPLYVASRNGYTEIVDLLVRAGADVNQADKVHIVLIALVYCARPSLTHRIIIANKQERSSSLVTCTCTYVHAVVATCPC